MSVSTYLDVLADAVIDNWTATPLEKPNVKFTPPQDAAYLSFNIQTGRRDNGALGNKSRVTKGLVKFRLFIPPQTSTPVAEGHLDTMATLFENKNWNSGVKTFVLNPAGTPAIDKPSGNWMYVVDLPFEQHEELA